jgi:hypothetical protein
LEQTYAPLPGQALVLRDNATGLFVDVLPCGDAYTNERALLAELRDWWRPGDVVVADSNFCTEELFRQLAAAEAFAVIRHHGSVGLHPLGKARRMGRNDSGEIWEQPVRYAETELTMRCVSIRLDQPTRDGDSEIRVLSTLPAEAAGAGAIAEAYRGRRGIENAFQELEAAVRSEIDTLAYPQAALFGFCIGLVLCNLLQVVRVAAAATPAAPPAERISGVGMGQQIATYLGALLLLELPTSWPQGSWSVARMAAWLQGVAASIDWRRYTKSQRGPKKAKQFERGHRSSPHASVARIIKQRSKKKSNAP